MQSLGHYRTSHYKEKLTIKAGQQLLQLNISSYPTDEPTSTGYY